jgi:hypothetical protein
MFTNTFGELNLYASQRVLFVHQGSLLDDGVLSLLGANKELEVMKVDYDGEKLLARDVTNLCPQVVVLEQTRTFKLKVLFDLLDKYINLQKLRVVIFHTNDNYVDIYCRKSMRAMNSQVFLEMLQGASVSF